MRGLVSCLILIGAACASGPAAPEVEPQSSRTACVDPFCITYPADWVVDDQGRDFISLSNPAVPGSALATVGPVNQQALVENAGGSWPAPTEAVVEAFWMLLEDADVADFERMERLTGGAFRSEGSYENGRLWHLLIPGTGNRAIAVEVRGPNASWQTHADVFFSNVQVFE